MLSHKTIQRFLAVLLICSATAVSAADQAAAPAPKPVIGKLCLNCHEAQQGSLRGNFEGVAYKTQSIQIKIDDATEIVRFDPANLKIANVKTDADTEEQPLRAIPKGKEVRVVYTEKDGKKTATEITAKPPIKVPAEKLISTAEVEKLVALGPEKGKYTLIDARPPIRFMDGSIPTAINIPFVAFDKMIDKLPKDKNALIIYFCQGFT